MASAATKGKALMSSLRKNPKVRNPEALAAWIGRHNNKLKGTNKSEAGKKIASSKSSAKGSRRSPNSKTARDHRVIPPTAHAAHGDRLEPGKIQSAAPARKMTYNGKDFDMRNVPSAEVGSPQTFVIDHPRGKDRFVVGSHTRGMEPPPPAAVADTYPRNADESKADAHKGALLGSYEPQQKKLVVERHGNPNETPSKETKKKLKKLYPLATKVVYNGNEYRLPPRQKS